MKYNSIAAPDTFIGSYMEYMSDFETATDYDFWSAIWLLSCAVGRSMVVDRPHAPVYMNPFIILVANSGVTRKSTAVSKAREIARELFADDPMLGLLETKTTPENLDRILHERSAATNNSGLAIAVSELAVFLGTERYNSAMPALLTDLYDCATSRRGGGTISRGTVDQSNIFVTFLSASTPAWLLRSVNPTVTEGGFTSRCIFVCSEHPKRRIAWSTTVSGHTEPLVRRLRIIREHCRNYRTVTINEHGLSAFRKWYAGRKLSLDTYRSSFESREDAHVLRLAAFLCINDNTWIIQHSHIQFAIKCIAETKTNAAKLFECRDAKNKWLLGIEVLQETLIKLGLDAIPRSHLYLKVRGHLDNSEFQALVDVMHEVGAIQRFTVLHNGAGRPADMIRGTKLLATKGFVNSVAEKLER